MKIITDYKTAHSQILSHMIRYFEQNEIKNLVIGISGGIDSALTAALARKVCDVYSGIFLIGRSISIDSNKPEEISRARKVGESFCHDFKEIDFTELYKEMWHQFEAVEGLLYTPVAKGNIKARIRMQYLYSIAGMRNGLVLSTDNKTEELLGFWTQHGDVGDYSPIQELWKGEVYELAKSILPKLSSEQKEAMQECINAVPTDGLGISNSDLDQIGVNTYDEADQILREFLSLGVKRKNCTKLWENNIVIQRHLKTEFKRKVPIRIPRHFLYPGNRNEMEDLLETDE